MIKQKDSAKLGRQDWIDTGLKVLATSGIEGIRVELLAKLMNVTKGSFYWHFKNREELLCALLKEWSNLDTDKIIEQLETTGGDASSKLLNLFELCCQDDGLLEKAIRAWATNDPKAASILAQVDRRRLDYTRDLFLQIGFTPFEAMVRARMAYYAALGEYTLGKNRIDREERLAQIRLQHRILTHKN
ncbi:MAG: TetR/AcrR family transcriptional regulator [Xenococcaceae cyanobacterium MO_188.B32]|nr:TetR/AcrR family transcriptional regulator [Xenococcaceae cyanobacterium MO_188.B32]